MSHKTVTAVATIPQAQLKDDKVAALVNALKCTAEEANALIERLEKQQQYRKQYAQRPDVRAKRAAYSKSRYQQLKLVASLLK